MNMSESSGSKSPISILGQMRRLHAMIQSEDKTTLQESCRLRRLEAMSSASGMQDLVQPPIPNCDGPDEEVDRLKLAAEEAMAGLRHALRVAILCHSGGTLLALSTEQEAALDLALELVAFAIG